MRNGFLQRVFFSAVTRILLGIALLFTDPLSVTFRYLIVIIFLLPVIRYVFHELQHTDMSIFFTGYPRLGMVAPFFITTGIAVLYVLVLAHILQIYTTSYFWWILMIIIPVICWYLLFGENATPTDTHVHNTRALLRTLVFYIIPFFFAVNYAFDFSTPRHTKYYITGIRDETIAVNDPDIREIEMYYLYLLPADSMAGKTHWQTVGEKKYYSVERYGPYMSEDSINYLVIDMKIDPYSTTTHFRERFQLLLLQTNARPVRRKVPYRLYKRFVGGDYLNEEEHRGLFGIKWVSYH